MTDPSTDDRLVEQLAATLRELPEDELARALHEPIDPQLRERLFDIMQTNRASAPTPVPAANDSGRRWAVVGLGVVLAAAAAVAVWFWPPKPPDATETPLIAIAPLPTYTLETDAGLATQRSGTEPAKGELTYQSNNQFTWDMSPKVRVNAPVNVRVCASSASGETVEIDIDPFLQISPKSGAVHLQGHVAALGLRPGHWTLAIAVGYPQILAEIGSICGASTAEGIHVNLLDVQLLGD
jgi:hypothetical protein